MNGMRNRVKSIFLEAVENCPPERWDAFLDEACRGEPDLRQRVQVLLDAHQRTDSLIDNPGLSATAALNHLPVAEGPGAAVGPYTLLEEIGEGGMGVVYVAEQNEPVRRTVALKVIKPGMDTQQVIARFEAERQALAMMDHPNIARVIDAGATGSGRPYFVMELVRGVSITEYCDREQLSITDRLDLFVLVCRAVQHAHQKGVIHRDLKPSNILVTVVDGAAVPKVIDFGVAKATGATLTDRTIYTGIHQFVGTPLYMSPEQADVSNMDTDVRSDVYSLGVLLYELLTGTTPFDQDLFHKAAFDELRRIIREEEPPKPSTRLSALGEARTTVSANRKVDSRHLDRTVRGELDWIVMKALEKDRRRRYDTAGDFAADVMRHLTDRPVEACPPSAFYRFGKLARRNRVALTTAGLLATALVLGTVVSTAQAIRASRAERKTAAALEKIRGLAEQGRLKQVQLNATHGARLIDEGDLPGALPWFVEVLRLDGQDPERAETHRIRLAAMLDQCPKPSQIWFHDQQVSHVEFRPDGRAVLAAAADGIVLVRDVATGEPIGPPLRHDHRVQHASFSPDGRRVVTACWDRTARVWEVATGRQVGAPLKLDGKAHHAAFLPDGRRVLTGAANTFRIWDTATGEPTTPAISHNGYTSLSPDGRLFVTGAYDKAARLWYSETGALATPPLQHDHGITFGSLGPDSFSRDGRRLATSCMDHAARIWDTTTGALVVPPLMHSAYIRHSCFSPDGRRLLTASDDGTARLWDAATGAPLRTPMEHGGAVMWAAYSPDGTRLVTSCVDHTARVWDAATARPLLPPLRHLSAVDRATFSPDGQFVLTRSSDRTVRLWDLATAAPVDPRRLTAAVGSPVNAFSEDGRILASIGRDGQPRLQDVATGAPVAQSDALVNGIWFSPDGRSFLSFKHDKSNRVDILVWDLATRTISAGPLRHQFKKPYAASQATWSPDSRRVVTAAGYDTVALKAPECEVRIWDARTGKPVTPVVPHQFPIFGLEFSRDGRFVATASGPAKDAVPPGEARILLASTGQLRIPPIRTPQACRVAQFSSDGARLLTACGALNLGEGEARVWDATTGQPVSPPMRHTGLVGSACFSPDGHRVLTASVDGTACLWDANTGALLVPPLRHRHPVDQVRISSDGRRVLTVSNPAYSHAATAGGPYYAQVWDAATGHPLTPPLRRERFIHNAAFSPDGHRVVSTSLRGGGAMLWTLEPDRRPFDDLIRLAEVLSGTRLDASGAAIPLQAEELRTAYEALRPRDPNAFTAGRAKLLGWHQQQVLLCEAAGQGRVALTHLDRVIELGSDVASLRDRRKVLRAGLEPEEMIALYRDAIRLDPDDPGIHNEFALALQKKGLHDEAIAEFREAIRLTPDDPTNHLELARTLGQKGPRIEAAAEFREAIRLKPDDAAAHFAFGSFLHGDSGAREAERAEFREAARLDTKGTPWARAELVWILTLSDLPRLRGPAEALEHARKAVEITQGQHPEFQRMLALAAYRSGLYEEALTALEKSNVLGGKESVTHWFLLAMIHGQKGENELARPWFDKGVAWMKAQSYQGMYHRLLWTEAADLLGLPGPSGRAAFVGPPRPPIPEVAPK